MNGHARRRLKEASCGPEVKTGRSVSGACLERMTRDKPIWAVRAQRGHQHSSSSDEGDGDSDYMYADDGSDLYTRHGFWSYQWKTLRRWFGWCPCFVKRLDGVGSYSAV